MKSNLKVMGVTISITWLAFITLAIFIKAIGVLFNSFFVENAIIIAIVSGILILILVITGAIAIGSLTRGGSGLFGWIILYMNFYSKWKIKEKGKKKKK